MKLTTNLMMKHPANLNRHVAGVTAILAAMAILGFAASTASSRRVASLPQEGVAIAQQAPTEAAGSDESFTAQLNNIPPNAYGSARPSEGTLGQTITNRIKAVLPSMRSGSAQSKNWSQEDWQIAERAVADHRASAKDKGNSGTNLAETIWQPPEEIANRKTPSQPGQNTR
jgi:hypothetical protein